MLSNKLIDKNKIILLKKNILKKKKIVLCHGVFDLLHIGHIKHFEESKKHGDILIVSLTHDEYINKGPNRPAFNNNHRLSAVAALECVDYVYLNKFPDAIEVIKTIKPNIYSKGQDYKKGSNDITKKINLEIKTVKKFNGKIIFTNENYFQL